MLAPRQAANIRRLKQFQPGRISLNKPVLLYWPKSVPQTSSLSLKLRITVDVGNRALSKALAVAWPGRKQKLMERVEESNQVMKRSQLVLTFFILILFYPVGTHAQLWNGIINPSRAMDWSQAGIPGGPADANWPICTTLSAGVTAAQITTALTNCHTSNPNGGVVVLNAGTYTISGQISIPSSNLVLRGAGANSTFLVATGTTPVIRASGDSTARGNGAANLVHNWTAGYAQGATQLTLDSVSGIVANRSILMLNQ